VLQEVPPIALVGLSEFYLDAVLERDDEVVGLGYFVEEVLERVILVHGENQGEQKQEGDR